MRLIITLCLLFIIPQSFVIFNNASAFGETTRVSINSSGVEGNSGSYLPSISSDGRYVAFQSYADNLLVGGTLPNYSNIFVHDRHTGNTELVSIKSNGEQDSNHSERPSLSADGSCVAFESNARLVDGDPYGTHDIYVHDRVAHQTILVSLSSTGVQGDSSSYNPSISSDGRYVAFESYAQNLVVDDEQDYKQDIFLHDRQTGQTILVTVDSNGNQADWGGSTPSISYNGRYIAFSSSSTNLVAGDSNGQSDIFVHDQQTGQTTLVSVSSTGELSNNGSSYPVISGDGRYVAFTSKADNLASGDTNGSIDDIYRHDRQTGQTILVSINTQDVEVNTNSSISFDGRYVAYEAGQALHTRYIYLHDCQLGETKLVSISSSVELSDGNQEDASISGDGLYIAFASDAENLVLEDTNHCPDIFVNRHSPISQDTGTMPWIPLLLLDK